MNNERIMLKVVVESYPRITVVSAKKRRLKNTILFQLGPIYRVKRLTKSVPSDLNKGEKS